MNIEARFSLGDIYMNEKISSGKTQRIGQMNREEMLSAEELEWLNLYWAMREKERKVHFAHTLDAAEKPGVARRTIQFWAWCGEIPAVRIGGKLKIHVESLKSYLARPPKPRRLPARRQVRPEKF